MTRDEGPSSQSTQPACQLCGHQRALQVNQGNTNNDSNPNPTIPCDANECLESAASPGGLGNAEVPSHQVSDSVADKLSNLIQNIDESSLSRLIRPGSVAGVREAGTFQITGHSTNSNGDTTFGEESGKNIQQPAVSCVGK